MDAKEGPFKREAIAVNMGCEDFRHPATNSQFASTVARGLPTLAHRE
jgi:hypothetical protein